MPRGRIRTSGGDAETRGRVSSPPRGHTLHLQGKAAAEAAEYVAKTSANDENKDPPASGEATDYEDLRQRNMARNAAFLASVGLLGVHPIGSQPPARPTKRARRIALAGEGVGPIDGLIDSATALTMPLRRSSRVATLSHTPDYRETRVEEPRESYYSSSHHASMVAYNEAWAGAEAEQQRGEGGPAHPSQALMKREEGAQSKPTRDKQEVAPSGGGRSSRDMHAHIAYFLLEGVLGVRLQNATKAPVMALAAGGACPAFNRCSGVSEWRNSIFLWVNVSSGGGVSGGEGDYPNEFFEGGRYMSWFGGSKMHADSPVVQRLLSATGDGGCVVLLMVRVDTEPYTCLGRVRAQSSDLARHPVAVRWELLDRDRLMMMSVSGTSYVDDGNEDRLKGESDFGRILRLVAEQTKTRKK